MHTGAITQDTLPGTFRSLSQKKRHGLFRISFRDITLSLSFYNGKIVQVLREGQSLSEEIVKKLQAAEKLKTFSIAEEEISNVSLEELYQQLVQNQLVAIQDFIRTKKAIELNWLYQLVTLQHGSYDFRQEIVHWDPTFSLSMSPGQLLLDLVDFDMYSKRFTEIFGGLRSLDFVLTPQLSELDGNGEDEGIIWGFVTKGQVSIKYILDHALLSDYHLKSILVSFFERKLISIAEKKVAEAPRKMLDKPKITPPLPPSPRVENSHLESHSLQATSGEGASKGKKENSSFITLEGIEEALKSFEPDFPDFVQTPQLPDKERKHDVDSASFLPHEQSENNRESQEEKFSNDAHEDIEQVGWTYETKTVDTFFSRINSFLLDGKIFHHVGLLITLIYLFVLGLTVPEMFHDWFQMMSSLNAHFYG